MFRVVDKVMEDVLEFKWTDLYLRQSGRPDIHAIGVV